MQIRQRGRWFRYVGSLLMVVVVFSGAQAVSAATSKSQNYEMTESQFNSGSTLQSCSGEYCTQASIGDMTSGRSGSAAGSTASFGAIPTSPDPLIEVIVEPGVSHLGVLSIDKTASKTMSVQVRTHLSDGYTLQITGDPPKYRDHVLSAPTSPVASTPGTEQFAINATKNTAPSIGELPVQVPSNETSFGQVMSSYAQADRFMYRSGDIVARSETESGRTDYTISMMINVATSTPAGHFSGDFSAVVVPIF